MIFTNSGFAVICFGGGVLGGSLLGNIVSPLGEFAGRMFKSIYAPSAGMVIANAVTISFFSSAPLAIGIKTGLIFDSIIKMTLNSPLESEKQNNFIFIREGQSGDFKKKKLKCIIIGLTSAILASLTLGATSGLIIGCLTTRVSAEFIVSSRVRKEWKENQAFTNQMMFGSLFQY